MREVCQHGLLEQPTVLPSQERLGELGEVTAYGPPKTGAAGGTDCGTPSTGAAVIGTKRWVRCANTDFWGSLRSSLNRSGWVEQCEVAAFRTPKGAAGGEDCGTPSTGAAVLVGTPPAGLSPIRARPSQVGSAAPPRWCSPGRDEQRLQGFGDLRLSGGGSDKARGKFVSP